MQYFAREILCNVINVSNDRVFLLINLFMAEYHTYHFLHGPERSPPEGRICTLPDTGSEPPEKRGDTSEELIMSGKTDVDVDIAACVSSTCTKESL